MAVDDVGLPPALATIEDVLGDLPGELPHPIAELRNR